MSQRRQMILGPMRTPFLILTLACVLLSRDSFSGQRTVQRAVHYNHHRGGLCSHISVNASSGIF